MGLDHLLGRPSSTWKRIESLFVVYATVKWLQANAHSTPQYFKRLNGLLRQFRPWQIVVLTLLARYLAGRLFLLSFLNAPEVYSKHYNRNFYRATWILTALDAGFWSASNIRPYFLRQVVSVLLSIWYLFQADDADVKVRKLRSDCSINMMRMSWEKSTSPIIWFLTLGMRPFIGHINELWIPRRAHLEADARFPTFRSHTRVKIYYAGSEKQLASVQKLVLHFPGGGFVTMSPENHEEYIRRWARTLGIAVAIASVDYGKAPEYPYPYAIEECFELYQKICESDGRILGVNCMDNGPSSRLKIVIAGDSAGGNITAAVTIKIIEALQRQGENFNSSSLKLPLQLQVTMSDPDLTAQSKKSTLRKPDALLIVYGALNFNMASWIAPDDTHAELLRPGSETSLSGLMKNYKGRKYHESRLTKSNVNVEKFQGFSSPFLSLTSRVAYFNDRIIPPELARAMSLLYLGSNSRINPATEYCLSPVNAPEDILMEFPRIWMMCGECDPFVDDTVVFAARVRSAVSKKYERYGYTDDEGATTDNSDAKTPRGIQALTPISASPTHDWDQSQSGGFSGWFRRLSDSYHTAKSHKSDDEYEDSDDDYGEISTDPNKHVTVKIYAGISHAYLNMIGFLPEAHHATALTGQWLCEMFDLSDRIAARKKRRRRRRAKRSAVRLEMRDEDNIPDTIDMPLGAEYRVGNLQIRVRNKDHSPQSRKYRIGDSDDEVEPQPLAPARNPSPEIPVFDEPNGSENPLLDAMVNKKRNLETSRKSISHGSAMKSSRSTNATPISAEKPLHVTFEKEKPKMPVSTPTAKIESSGDMFLSEQDLLSKRQNIVTKEVYSGVSQHVIEHHSKKASNPSSKNPSSNNLNSLTMTTDKVDDGKNGSTDTID